MTLLLRCAPSELSVIDPHSMEDDGKFSGNGNHGASMTSGFR